MTGWSAALYAATAAVAVPYMARCDLRDRAGFFAWVLTLAGIAAMAWTGMPDHVAGGFAHLVLGWSLVHYSTRTAGVAVGMLSFAIAILVGLSMHGIIPTGRGAGIAFNIHHWGMVLQWGQLAVFAAMAAGRKEFSRELG